MLKMILKLPKKTPVLLPVDEGQSIEMLQLRFLQTGHHLCVQHLDPWVTEPERRRSADHCDSSWELHSFSFRSVLQKHKPTSEEEDWGDPETHTHVGL